MCCKPSWLAALVTSIGEIAKLAYLLSLEGKVLSVEEGAPPMTTLLILVAQDSTRCLALINSLATELLKRILVVF